MSYAATFLEEKDLDLRSAQGIEISLLFEFLIEILRHQSLTVSIPVLHSWSRLLATERIEEMQVVTHLIAPLLEKCTQRLVRWENLPEDSEDPTILFLNEDIDTIPERHAFVGNYRRYCSTVIEIIVQKRPHEAIPHILAGVDQNLNNLYSGVQPFSGMISRTRLTKLIINCVIVESFQKLSFPLMRADTQFSVVEATLKGYQKWIIAHGGSPQQDVRSIYFPTQIGIRVPNLIKQEQQRTALELTIENWAMSLMQRSFEVSILTASWRAFILT
jgi:exportin-5